jgi:hypothetical protein
MPNRARRGTAEPVYRIHYRPLYRCQSGMNFASRRPNHLYRLIGLCDRPENTRFTGLHTRHFSGLADKKSRSCCAPLVQSGSWTVNRGAWWRVNLILAFALFDDDLAGFCDGDDDSWPRLSTLDWPRYPFFYHWLSSSMPMKSILHRRSPGPLVVPEPAIRKSEYPPAAHRQIFHKAVDFCAVYQVPRHLAVNNSFDGKCVGNVDRS